ncbi:hypothetical protein [Pseudoflavonifractor sp. HCP28S3_F10]|uniref:hypothetical protein n=1 Tax=Pseudoflavonifractor sp. HCP28S3_F10 TaxID=3438947 RepID=UPI003F8CAFD7
MYRAAPFFSPATPVRQLSGGRMTEKCGHFCDIQQISSLLKFLIAFLGKSGYNTVNQSSMMVEEIVEYEKGETKWTISK